jgi:hypothetical protein
MIGKRESTPNELALEDLAMDAVATTEYPAAFIIDARKYFIFQAITTTSGVFGGAGTATLRLDFFSKKEDPSSPVLTYQTDLATLLSTNTAAETNVILWGAGAAAAIFGNGTLGTDLGVAKVVFFVRPVVVVTVQANAAALMSVRWNMEG